MRQDDHRLFEVLEFFTLAAQQMAQNGFFDVEQIGRARAELFRWQALPCLGMATNYLAYGVFGGLILVLDKGVDLADQLRVFDQQGMSGEDGPVLFAELLVDRLLAAARFFGGGGQRRPQPGAFVAALAAVDEAMRDPVAFGVHHEGGTDGDSRRDRDAAFDFHGWSLVISPWSEPERQ